ncbi:MAG: HlyD family efflux transporter periplasmic adaptor subunit [Dysgonamonadaceae bacterium]|nr:HlyD family efflux transporter periplasmic adaptor subunit [Dysgonamonadaceae bacterium]MDD4727126.1 HlyD family efflux transporter periplasmic adaptor subunit [Dysgonamonadaceae bacterium]
MKKQLFLLTITLLLVSACTNKGEDNAPASAPSITRIVGIGKVIPQGGISDLAAPVSGIVKRVNVQTGDIVEKGDVLLVLDNTDASFAVKEADSRLVSQQGNVQSVKNLVERERIAVKEKMRLLNDSHELFAVGAISGEKVRELQNDYDQGLLQLKKLGSDMDGQQALLQELTVQHASKLNNLSQAQLTAPIDGTVLDIALNVGEAVTAYQTYGRLAPHAPLMVVAEIDELFAGELALGQPCSVAFIGDSVLVAEGEILRISPNLKTKSLFSDSGNDMEDRRVREIEVLLSNITRPLLIETKLECTVLLN